MSVHHSAACVSVHHSAACSLLLFVTLHAVTRCSSALCHAECRMGSPSAVHPSPVCGVHLAALSHALPPFGNDSPACRACRECWASAHGGACICSQHESGTRLYHAPAGRSVGWYGWNGSVHASVAGRGRNVSMHAQLLHNSKGCPCTSCSREKHGVLP